MSNSRGRTVLLAGAAVLYLFCFHAYYVGFFNDDAFYIIGARSLLQGRFAELNAPGAPPLVNYLPGFPLLLMPAAAVGSALAYQLTSWALLLGGLAAFAALAEALCPQAALAALALAAFTPLSVSMSGTVLSDVPLLAGVMLTLLLARRSWDKKGFAAWLAPAAAAAFCCLIRPTGAAVPLALVVALALELRWKPAAAVYTLAALLVVPLMLRNRLLTGHGLIYAVELANPYAGAGRWTALRLNALSNLGYYLKLVYASMLFRWPGDSAALTAATIGVGAVVTGYGFADGGWKGWRKLPPLFLLIFVCGHLIWGKQAGRYMLPALPLLFAYFLRGAAVLRGKQAASGAAVLALALLALPDARIVEASWTRKTPVTRAPERTIAWIKARTSEEDVFATELDGRFYLLTGRRAAHLNRLFKPEELPVWLAANGAKYVAVLPNDFAMHTQRGDAFNDPLPTNAVLSLLNDETRYELLFADPQERTAVYRLR